MQDPTPRINEKKKQNKFPWNWIIYIILINSKAVVDIAADYVSRGFKILYLKTNLLFLFIYNLKILMELVNMI